MSACNNLLWAGLGAFAGYALAVKLFEDEQADAGDQGEGSEVDDDADPEIDVPVMKIQEWDGEQWVN